MEIVLHGIIAISQRQIKMRRGSLLFIYLSFFCSCSGSDVIPNVNNGSVSVNPTELSVGCQASTQMLTVTATADWAVYSNSAWCKVSPSGGTAGNGIVTIVFEANTNATSRSTTLTFKSGTNKQSFAVNQEKNDEDLNPEIKVPDGYQLVWNDEFNNSLDANGKGALPSSSEWWYETGKNGWGNNELENYVSAVNGADTAAVVSNGSLKIIARKSGSDIISARMNTFKSWTYGYFEARLKLPKGKGTWPAFWMMHKNFTSWPLDGEIDIMEEVGYNPGYVSSSIHCMAYYHKIGTQKTAQKYVSTAESDYHVYALEWTADFVKGYIDGEKYFEFDNDKKGDYNTWPFNNPFYLKLNLAWGGDWGGSQGVDESALPCTYQIDYVRVFQKK